MSLGSQMSEAKMALAIFDFMQNESESNTDLKCIERNIHIFWQLLR